MPSFTSQIVSFRHRLSTSASRGKKQCKRKAFSSASSTGGVDRIKYRGGSSSDLSVIRAILVSQMMNPLNLVAERFVVAENSDGRVVGFCQLVDHDLSTAELRSLYVVDAERKSGVGRTLVDLVAKKAGGHKVYLVTPSYRTKFYELCGFQSLTPWELPTWLLPDVVLGSIILAIVAQCQIIGMMRDCTVPARHRE